MVEAGAVAYPVLLWTMYGVARVGRRERWGVYEWLRLGALGLLFGLVVAVQVKLLMIGLAREPLPLLAALASFTGTSLLLALYLRERWIRAAAGPAPPEPQAEPL